MRRIAALVTILCAIGSNAQQGFVPLSTEVDMPYTALMHQVKASRSVHSAMRPYLREDLALLPGADTLLPQAWKPWLQRITDPAQRWHGGPLIDAQVGASFGDVDVMKYRGGLGGWVEWNATPNWSLHVDAMGWNETMPNYLDLLSKHSRVTAGEGYAHANGSSFTHYDWNAYADYKAGKYFHFTLGRGKHFIGEGYRSLFLSDNATSYPYFKITTTAWHIRYTNLFTMMNDIRGSGGDASKFIRKYCSMHYLSWNVSKRFNIGFFEAVVWEHGTEEYPRGFDINYLNPVIFYRPTEFSLGSPDNALMGFAVNVKLAKKVLVYSQLMLDEFLFSEVRSGDGWYANKQAIQVGAVGHDCFNVKNLMLRAEFNYVRPFMFTHNDSLQNYTHYGQPLAHPYGNNFWEVLVQGEYRTGRMVFSDLASIAVMGQDTDQYSYGNSVFAQESQRPLTDGVHYKNYGYDLASPSRLILFHNELRAGWLVEPRSGLMLEAAWTFRIREPESDVDLNTAHITNYLRIGLVAYFHERHVTEEARYTLH